MKTEAAMPYSLQPLNGVGKLNRVESLGALGYALVSDNGTVRCYLVKKQERHSSKMQVSKSIKL